MITSISLISIWNVQIVNETQKVKNMGTIIKAQCNIGWFSVYAIL